MRITKRSKIETKENKLCSSVNKQKKLVNKLPNVNDKENVQDSEKSKDEQDLSEVSESSVNTDVVKKSKAESRKERKKQYLEYLKKALGVQSEACRRMGIFRQTIIRWKKSDPIFRRKIHDIEESAVGTVEMVMFDKIINDKDTNLIKFFLLTRAKNRYSYDPIQKQQVPTVVLNISKEESEF